MSEFKVGDKVRVKDYKTFTGDYIATYAGYANSSRVYEIEKITYAGDVYVKDRINYFRQSSLELVE